MVVSAHKYLQNLLEPLSIIWPLLLKTFKIQWQHEQVLQHNPEEHVGCTVTWISGQPWGNEVEKHALFFAPCTSNALAPNLSNDLSSG